MPMESFNSWLRICIANKVTLEQLVFLKLIKNKDFLNSNSDASFYIKKVQRFSQSRVIAPLIKGELLMDFNTGKDGKLYPERMVLTQKGDDIFATYQMGLEVWDLYPKTFPIGGGGSFIARAGIDKDDFVEAYLKKIDNDPAKHKIILRRLDKYKNMVFKGAINGYKISDWLAQELWDAIDDDEQKSFGRDV